jgi:hypothetical protein
MSAITLASSVGNWVKYERSKMGEVGNLKIDEAGYLFGTAV